MSTRYWLIACLITATVCASAADEKPKAQIPSDAVEFNGHHYKLFDNVENLNWETAKKQCEEWGGHLVIITDQAEADFIAELCGGAYMYLGASDAAEEGTWVWVDGTPMEFTFWMDGQPNDYGGTEDYLATYDAGDWVDVDVEGDAFWMPTGFICEWDE